MKRRHFIKTTAGLAALAAGVPALEAKPSALPVSRGFSEDPSLSARALLKLFIRPAHVIKGYSATGVRCETNSLAGVELFIKTALSLTADDKLIGVSACAHGATGPEDVYTYWVLKVRASRSDEVHMVYVDPPPKSVLPDGAIVVRHEAPIRNGKFLYTHVTKVHWVKSMVVSGI